MSQKQTILVFGSNGMLGRYVASYFETVENYQVVRFGRKEVDASKVTYQQLHHILEKYHDAYVINCIGRIPQRGDTELKSYLQINTVFPHMLAAVCGQTGNKLIHITTDCVYTGKKGKYTENDVADETNFYGMSKSLGEPDNCCIIRTSIIGEEIENKRSLLEWVRSKNGQTISGFSNHFWNGVTCLQLAKIVHEMIEKGIYWLGVRHIFPPDKVSKYQLVQMIVDIFGLDIMVEKKETEIVDKSLDTIYDKLFNIPTISEQINELKEFGNNLC